MSQRFIELHARTEFLLARLKVCKNQDARRRILNRLRELIDDLDEEVNASLPEPLGADFDFLGQLDLLA